MPWPSASAADRVDRLVPEGLGDLSGQVGHGVTPLSSTPTRMLGIAVRRGSAPASAPTAWNCHSHGAPVAGSICAGERVVRGRGRGCAERDRLDIADPRVARRARARQAPTAARPPRRVAARAATRRREDPARRRAPAVDAALDSHAASSGVEPARRPPARRPSTSACAPGAASAGARTAAAPAPSVRSCPRARPGRRGAQAEASPATRPGASARSSHGQSNHAATRAARVSGENGARARSSRCASPRATTFDSISCAAIVTATSSGVRAPIWMPIGAWSRARSASPTPASRSRAVALGARLLAADRADEAGVRAQRELERGHVELEVVRHQADRRPRVDRRARRGTRRATRRTSSSASGKRSRVRNTLRGSQTVTR